MDRIRKTRCCADCVHCEEGRLDDWGNCECCHCYEWHCTLRNNREVEAYNVCDSWKKRPKLPKFDINKCYKEFLDENKGK